MPRPRRRPPRAHVVGGEWPAAQLDGDAAAVAAQQFVANLAAATVGMSLRAVEAVTGVDHDTVARVLRGDTWPDMATVANLEHGLGKKLWPEPSQAEGTAAQDTSGD